MKDEIKVIIRELTNDMLNDMLHVLAQYQKDDKLKDFTDSDILNVVHSAGISATFNLKRYLFQHDETACSKIEELFKSYLDFMSSNKFANCQFEKNKDGLH